MGSTSVSIGTLSHTLGGCNLRYLFFRQKGTGAKYVAMTTKLEDSLHSCAKFKEYHTNISRDIIESLFAHF